MSKPFLLFKGPVATRSGYGDHARDLLESLFELDKYDIKVVPTRWGNTPQNQLNPTTEVGKKIIENCVTKIEKQPDIFVQLTVANEFEPIGKYNIGITAGVETTVAPKEFIDGCNRMNLIIVPTKFTKQTLLDTVYDERDNRTQQLVRQIKVTTPIEVLHEGVDLETWQAPKKIDNFLEGIETDFNFLVCGHWLQGDLGQDRKDIGMTIKTFCTVFKSLPKGKQPGLILKTSTAGFSVMDRENITKKIDQLIQEVGEKCPPIYLLFGDLSVNEMANLYHHPKVKAMVSFTKGEGYGRPLCEFTLTGKPIIVSKWSGHTDFLPENYTVYIDGELKEVHPSAANQFLLKEAKWFSVNYSDAAKKIFDVFNNYKSHLVKSANLKINTRKFFSLKHMTTLFNNILTKHANIKVPERVELKLPEIKKL
tara:strand:- start:2090 stop:3358 length:1269 start_codon:yes stop_codon:yes gene_type:complete